MQYSGSGYGSEGWGTVTDTVEPSTHDGRQMKESITRFSVSLQLKAQIHITLMKPSQVSFVWSLSGQMSTSDAVESRRFDW